MGTMKIEGDMVKIDREEIPVVWRGDVLVAGGGPAGLGAAIAAHRKGNRTLLLEQHGFLGGMCSYGAGMPLGGAYPGLRTIGGIAEEILTMVRNAGKDAADVRHMPLFGDWYFHDSEYFKSMISKMVLDEKLEVRLHTFAGGVIMDGDRRVAGIIADSKSGRQAYLAKTIIDATGDADICAWAGAAFEKGDENGAMMGVTIVFNMGGVDTDAYSEYLKTDPGLKKALQKAEENGYPVNKDDKYTSIHLGMRPNSLFMNSVRIRNIDGTSAEDLTRAELEGRVRMMEQVGFFREYVPGCADCYIMNSGAQVGIRDTRRIVGEDYLSMEDCLSLRKRPDSVVLRCTGPFDNTTRGMEREYVLNDIDMEQWYDIPYGCIVPKDLDNVVVAGRTFSCHYMALTSSRGQALLMGLGQAAGTAADLAIRSEAPFKAVNVKALQDVLRKDGCVLD
ncbi:FAD-dependent oxidoreductase [Clostridium sp. AN503]|uniref:FAD-dependent oxidoreductase n=1 Tax=Clostridium sp. AN503 TaxID=3160598 RepID=UPI003459A0EC